MIAVIETGSVDKAINYISEILIGGVLGGKKVSEIYLREKTLDNDTYKLLVEEVIKLIKYNDNTIKTNNISADDSNGNYINHLTQIKLTVSYRDGLSYNLSADTVHYSFNDFVKCEYFLDNRTKSVSVHSVEEAVKAQECGADRLLTGHIFATKCKDTAPRGLEYLTDIVQSVNIPVVAIGGITAENYLTVIKAGASDIAVMNSWRENR